VRTHVRRSDGRAFVAEKPVDTFADGVVIVEREQFARDARLVRHDNDREIRGILKPFGLLAGKGVGKTFAEKVRSLVPDSPLHDVVEALLRSWEAINKEVATLSRRLVTEARQDDTVSRLMTAPGVGVLVALTYVSTIGDPARFPHSSSVGAYIGLTPRRFQSGETPARSRAAATG